MSDRRYVYLTDGSLGRRLEPYLPGSGNPRVLLGNIIPTISTPYLPFDMPARSALAASPFKVWTHYFSQFPIEINNARPNDYYHNLWLPPGAFDGGTHWENYGGWIRDEPIRRGISPATSSVTVAPGTVTPRYTIDDKLTELRQVRDMGADGFTVDILQSRSTAIASLGGLSAGPYRQWNELIYAANELNDPTVKLVMMPDCKAAGAVSVNSLRDDMVAAGANPSVYRTPDGKLLVAPYSPEAAPANTADPNFWPAWQTAMNTAGEPSNVWLVFSSNWTAAPPAIGGALLNPIAYGMSRWGLRNPVDNLTTGSGTRGAAAYSTATFGKPWMAPVSPTDERMKAGLFNECRNSENLRVTWEAAIEQKSDGCTAVQITTWNDYSESAHIAPSRNHGFCLVDISSYYVAQFKLGYTPPIIRDCLYLSHRVQFVTGTTYTAPNPPYATKSVVSGGTTPVNTIEALAFLESPGTVRIKVNGTVVYSQSCPAGMTSVKCPLQLGNISADVIRGSVASSAVASPFPVASTQISQDMNYRYTSSLRG